MAGTGKTSISKTVCEQASEDAEIILGGSFFCSRSTGLAAQRDIRCVIPTLTRLLARDSVEFRLALAETIHDEIQHKEVSTQVELLFQSYRTNVYRFCLSLMLSMSVAVRPPTACSTIPSATP